MGRSLESIGTSWSEFHRPRCIGSRLNLAGKFLCDGCAAAIPGGDPVRRLPGLPGFGSGWGRGVLRPRRGRGRIRLVRPFGVERPQFPEHPRGPVDGGHRIRHGPADYREHAGHGFRPRAFTGRPDRLLQRRVGGRGSPRLLAAAGQAFTQAGVASRSTPTAGTCTPTRSRSCTA